MERAEILTRINARLVELSERELRIAARLLEDLQKGGLYR